MKLLEQLKWRYAVKRMTGTKIPAEKLQNILEAIRLSASSAGLQPYNIIIVDDKELLEKIKGVANNQPQITEASELLIFAAWSNFNQNQIDSYINNIAATREIDVSSLNGLKGMLGNMYSNRTPEQLFEWAARQSYIALGTGLAAAAMEEVDATPMEGFSNEQLDTLLGLKEKGLKSVSLMVLGFRDEANDFLSKAAKVRKPADELFLHIP